mmetsp:Transcript_17512/g.54702  ORF Transcript_17512/g.54702 Transcript_17512/m.54702 type:complete len:206 (-) Transcript_17512:382-999(-)
MSRSTSSSRGRHFSSASRLAFSYSSAASLLRRSHSTRSASSDLLTSLTKSSSSSSFLSWVRSLARLLSSARLSRFMAAASALRRSASLACSAASLASNISRCLASCVRRSSLYSTARPSSLLFWKSRTAVVARSMLRRRTVEESWSGSSESSSSKSAFSKRPSGVGRPWMALMCLRLSLSFSRARRWTKPSEAKSQAWRVVTSRA